MSAALDSEEPFGPVAGRREPAVAQAAVVQGHTPFLAEARAAAFADAPGR